MLKASALYMVMIIALVIAVLCSAMIVSTYFFHQQYQHKFRHDVLENNLESGIHILLSADSTDYYKERSFSLYNNGTDSVSLKRQVWGLYDIGMVKAFNQQDTIYKTFMIANTLDSMKWGAMYLIDEGRPISLSGRTLVRGNVFLPKAGIKEAFVDNNPYLGDKRLVIGDKRTSTEDLPELQKQRLANLESNLNKVGTEMFSNLNMGKHSFLSKTTIFHLEKGKNMLSHLNLSGNLILYADTLLIIDSTAVLDNILIFAKSILVKEGFTGRCQLFASDYIEIEENCRFDYPSSLGVLRFDTTAHSPLRISLGQWTAFNGVLFTFETKVSEAQTLIDLGENVKIIGQIYAQGMVRYKDDTKIYGSIYTKRFIYQNSSTLFENYLINLTIDASNLSPYYLSSPLFAFSSTEKKILQWME